LDSWLVGYSCWVGCCAPRCCLRCCCWLFTHLRLLRLIWLVAVGYGTFGVWLVTPVWLLRYGSRLRLVTFTLLLRFTHTRYSYGYGYLLLAVGLRLVVGCYGCRLPPLVVTLVTLLWLVPLYIYHGWQFGCSSSVALHKTIPTLLFGCWLVIYCYLHIARFPVYGLHGYFEKAAHCIWLVVAVCYYHVTLVTLHFGWLVGSVTVYAVGLICCYVGLVGWVVAPHTFGYVAAGVAVVVGLRICCPVPFGFGWVTLVCCVGCYTRCTVVGCWLRLVCLVTLHLVTLLPVGYVCSLVFGWLLRFAVGWLGWLLVGYIVGYCCWLLGYCWLVIG